MSLVPSPCSTAATPLLAEEMGRILWRFNGDGVLSRRQEGGPTTPRESIAALGKDQHTALRDAPHHMKKTHPATREGQRRG
jgi:hypothetical protein